MYESEYVRWSFINAVEYEQKNENEIKTNELEKN